MAFCHNGDEVGGRPLVVRIAGLEGVAAERDIVLWGPLDFAIVASTGFGHVVCDPGVADDVDEGVVIAAHEKHLYGL